jgi:hypothetical protein
VVIQQLTQSTEEYDGSAWTGGGTMSTARRVLAGAGTQTAALGIGGIQQQLTLQTQKNMMELLGQQEEI